MWSARIFGVSLSCRGTTTGVEKRGRLLLIGRAEEPGSVTFFTCPGESDEKPRTCLFRSLSPARLVDIFLMAMIRASRVPLHLAPARLDTFRDRPASLGTGLRSSVVCSLDTHYLEMMGCKPTVRRPLR